MPSSFLHQTFKFKHPKKIWIPIFSCCETLGFNAESGKRRAAKNYMKKERKKFLKLLFLFAFKKKKKTKMDPTRGCEMKSEQRITVKMKCVSFLCQHMQCQIFLLFFGKWRVWLEYLIHFKYRKIKKIKWEKFSFSEPNTTAQKKGKLKTLKISRGNFVWKHFFSHDNVHIFISILYFFRLFKISFHFLSRLLPFLFSSCSSVNAFHLLRFLYIEGRRRLVWEIVGFLH